MRSVPLRGGTSVPQIGFGVFRVPPEETQRVVEAALAAGYRHIDTAAAYNNEQGVGAAIRASGLPRDEVFVTTKLRNGDQGREEARAAIGASLRRLGLDHLDLYLIHWPSPARDRYRESWAVLEEAQRQGDLSAIGVSNFEIAHLDRLLATADVPPAVDQLEVHPTFQQRELLARCSELGIAVEAYSPLGEGADLQAPTVRAIAERVGATPAQVVLAWHLRRERVVLPKTVTTSRMTENLAAADVALGPDDLEALDDLDGDDRRGNDPATFEISQIR